MAEYNIRDFGAIGDGLFNNAAILQKVIDKCSNDGGGTVTIPSGGNFMTGSFELKSNVNFHLEHGAHLTSAKELESFPHKVFGTGPEGDKRVWIHAKKANNITLSGGGCINGLCRAFATEELPYMFNTVVWRPAMTCFLECSNIRIHDLTFKDSANWALHFTGCDDIVVESVKIKNDLKFPNCDGIDPDHSRNVRISNCHIEAGDDCIVLKNTSQFVKYGPTENITVTNCTLISTSAAIKIGTESCNDFRNIVFSNCVIRDSHRGIALQLRDNGLIENVLFSNMTIETRFFTGGWWGAAEPIYITALPRTEQTSPGRIRNIRFRDMLCKGENGIYVHGVDQSRIDDIKFDNVKIEVAKTSRWPGGVHDKRPYFKESMVNHPTAGFYIENASNISLNNCEVAWGPNPPEYYNKAIETVNVNNLENINFKGKNAH